MKKLAALLLLLFASQVFAQDTGFFTRANCATINAPVANSTACLQTTTTGGRVAGQIYVWSGSAYVQVTGPSGTGCVSSGSSILSGDGAGGCANVTVGSGLDFTTGTLSATGGSGGLTLVENKTVTSNSTTVTFSGLNGNTDGVYILQARIINNSGGNTKYTMQPNGVSTNQSSYFHYNINGLAGVNAATWMLTDDTADVGNGVWMNVAVTIWAKNNPNSIAAIRQYQGMLGIATTSPAATSAQIAGVWNETSTNLTSLDVVAANANGIGNGSTLALYKYAQ